MFYIQYDSDNNIQFASESPFDGAVAVDFDVVTGYDGKLYKKGEEPVKTEEELDADRAAEIRAERDQLLAETDFMLMPDYPLSDDRRAVLTAYRQALRDVPAQAGFPRQIAWPEKPMP